MHENKLPMLVYWVQLLEKLQRRHSFARILLKLDILLITTINILHNFTDNKFCIHHSCNFIKFNIFS